MKRSHVLFAVAFACGCAASAFSQSNLLVNGSFETPNEFADNPYGWKDFTNAGERWRAIGDGQGPVFAHTGTHSIELASGNNFEGFTSDEDMPDLGRRNNAPVHFPGPDCTVSGWYYIPSNQPLTNAKATIKLEFRRPNNSVFTAVEHLDIQGHTNNQWVKYEYTVTNDFIMDIVADFPPGPTSVSVLPIRFGSFTSTGTIFWDDVEITQGCPADFDGDGFVTGDDFDQYVAAFELGDTAADFNGDGFVTGDDFDQYVAAFEAGC